MKPIPEFSPEMDHAPHEFAFPAGPGLLMDYGKSDNLHSVNAHERLARMKAITAYGLDTVDPLVAPCPADCKTGE